MQINNEAFESWREKRIAKSVIAEGKPFVFGSDAHNMSKRSPNWDMLQKKVKPDVVALSDSLLDKYTR